MPEPPSRGELLAVAIADGQDRESSSGSIVIAGSTVIEYDRLPVASMLSVTVTSIVNGVGSSWACRSAAHVAQRQSCRYTGSRVAVARARATGRRELLAVAVADGQGRDGRRADRDRRDRR